jgi:hypothetical protein
MAGKVRRAEDKRPWLKLASDWLALIPIPKRALSDQFDRTTAMEDPDSRRKSFPFEIGELSPGASGRSSPYIR